MKCQQWLTWVFQNQHYSYIENSYKKIIIPRKYFDSYEFPTLGDIEMHLSDFFLHDLLHEQSIFTFCLFPNKTI